MFRVFQIGVLAAVTALAGAAPAVAQSGSQSGTTSLGSITLTRAVTANGEPLPAGRYTVRLTADAPDPAVGQTRGAERWVEFVRGGKVVGREVVTVVPDTEIGEIAKGPRPPRGGHRVELLKGGDYVRVWINRGGNHYLIHFPA